MRSPPSNIQTQQFGAERPNQRSIAEFSSIWILEGCNYVSVVIDLFSRQVAGWSTSAAMTAQLVTAALLMGV
jgi:putative transposase